MNERNIVELRNISFSYENRIIIKDLSLNIKDGQVVAIMGGSGVGKTTLLRLIAGLQFPLDGAVKIMGQNIQDLGVDELNLIRRKQGFLFQFGALFTDLSCFENVAFPVREHFDFSESVVKDLVLLKLETVGLRGAASLMPAEISGGMARRVALARATVLDPNLILYDEPFAGLDPISLNTTAKLIRTLNVSLKATSIIVTHDVAETLEIADKVVLLSQSKNGAIISCQGNPNEVINFPDAGVQQFLKGSNSGPVKFHYPSTPIIDIVK